MSSEKPLVLVVDDDEDFRRQLGMQLEAAGYAVIQAPGEAAASDWAASSGRGCRREWRCRPHAPRQVSRGSQARPEAT